MIAALFLFLAAVDPETQVRAALAAKTGVVTLPAGTIEISREITLPSDAHDLEIKGSKTTLKMSPSFRGRALIALPSGRNINIHDIALDGNRDALARPVSIAPAEAMYSRFMANNGILAEGVTGLEIGRVKATGMAGFAILVNAGHNVRIHDVEIAGSGGLNIRKRNNGTGGILLEEGTTDFEVTQCHFAEVRGNGIATRSLAHSATNERGRIAGNEFAQIARNAILVDHAANVRVENNRGRMIGYPPEEADVEARAVPAAIAASGVEQSFLRNNQFEEIDGRCFDLEGFRNGEVSGNSCLSEDDELTAYPLGNFGIALSGSNVRITGNTIDGSIFGAILVAGSGNAISGNHLQRLNRAHCNEPGPFNCQANPTQPDLMRSGVYLSPGARGNTVENNEIGGYGMSRYCVVAAPGIPPADNRVAKNDCADEASFAFARFPARAQSEPPH